MSERELMNMEISQIKSLYESEMERLHQMLLSGVPWQETSAQRDKIGAFYKVLYKKRNISSFSNPAEGNTRKDR